MDVVSTVAKMHKSTDTQRDTNTTNLLTSVFGISYLLLIYNYLEHSWLTAVIFKAISFNKTS